MRGLALAFGAVLVAAAGVGVATSAAADETPVWARTFPPPETILEVRLDTTHRLLAGRERISFRNPTSAPLDRALLWLYPNRLAEPPAALDDVDRTWVYPLRFEPAFMRVVDVLAGGRRAAATVRSRAPAGRDTLLEVGLPEPVPPGGEVVVEVSFQARLPERFGHFGCWGESCTLLGGFYPMLAEIGAGGWDLAAPPAVTRIVADLVLDRELDGVCGGEVRHGVDFRIAVERATHLACVFAPRLHEATRLVGRVTVRYLAEDRPPPADDAHDQIIPYTEENFANMVLNAASAGLGLLAASGAEPPARTELVLVAAPLRVELATAQPGMVVVSDRLFHIFPAQTTRKFHERELVRAIYTELLAADRLDLPARERDLAAEAGAAWLLDLFEVGIEKGTDTAHELLSPVAFVPQIDTLIEAQQVPFADAYFGAVADPDRFRDDVRKFGNDRPRGSVLYQKLRDRLPAAELAATMRRVVLEPVTLRDAVPPGSDWQAFFDGWGGKYPAVNYRLGPRTREQLADGRWRHHVVVEKILPPGATWPIEPVTVRVVDGGGKPHDLVWSGEGTRGEVTLDSATGDLDSVEIDPGRRLVETDLGDGNDPRFDDRSPPRLRLLYSGLGVVVNVSDFSVGLLLNLLVRRVNDLRHLFSLQIFANEATTVGASVGYFHRFGTKATPARLVATTGLTLTVSRLSPTFGLAPSAGWRGSLGASVGWDGRATFEAPTSATIASAAVRATWTRFDAGGADLATVSFGGTLGRIFSPLEDQNFILSVDAAAVAGDLQYRPQLVGAGGDSALPGYGIGELFGRAALLGHLEWRSVLVHDLDWNVGHATYVRGFGFAALFDAGFVSGCSTYADLLDRQSFYASVGFSLRLFHDSLGVQPNVMSVDVAAPLIIRPRQCLGAPNLDTSGARPPIMVYLTFYPA